LKDVHRDLAPLAAQGNVRGFLNNVKNVDRLGGMVEDIRDAMMEYQVCVYEPSVSGTSDGTSDVCDRPRCNKISMTGIAGSL